MFGAGCSLLGAHCVVRCQNCRRINLIDFSRIFLVGRCCCSLCFSFIAVRLVGGFSASFRSTFVAHLFVSCHFLFAFNDTNSYAKLLYVHRLTYNTLAIIIEYYSRIFTHYYVLLLLEMAHRNCYFENYSSRKKAPSYTYSHPNERMQNNNRTTRTSFSESRHQLNTI